MKKIITILFTGCCLFSVKAQQWTEVGGPQGFSAGQAFWVTMDLDGTTPYVAYRDCANSCSPTVMTYNGTAWQNVGTAGITGSNSDYVCVGLNQAVPYVAFSDGANSGKLSVMKYVSGNWTYLGTSTGVSTAGAIYASMAFDNFNNLFVAYQEGTTTVVKKWNGTMWSDLPMSAFTAHPLQPNLSIRNNVHYFSFWDGNAENVQVWKFNPAMSNWGQVGSSLAGIAPSKVCFDASGTPYLAYTDATTTKPVVVKFDGTAWVSVGGAFVESTPAGNPTSGLGLTMDGNTPYVMYSDISGSGTVHVAKYDGSSWIQMGTAPFSVGYSPDYYNIRIIDGYPFIAYQGHTSSNLMAVAMKYSPTSTDVTALAAENRLSIYPNPAKDEISVDIALSGKNAVAGIYDVTGALVRSVNISNDHTTISIADLQSGMYFLETNYGSGTVVKRFIKE